MDCYNISRIGVKKITRSEGLSSVMAKDLPIGGTEFKKIIKHKPISTREHLKQFKLNSNPKSIQLKNILQRGT